jgi:hypothetical protein
MFENPLSLMIVLLDLSCGWAPAVLCPDCGFCGVDGIFKRIDKVIAVRVSVWILEGCSW